MTYSNKLVAVLVANGDILRESRKNGEDIVYLPWGQDYSIKFKNLNTRKALVNVSIDGKDVLDGKHLILEPNSESTLEGFMDGMSVKNKFRFIKMTQQIKEYRGEKIDDGIIRIEYQYEKEPDNVQKTVIHEMHYYDYYGSCPRCNPKPRWWYETYLKDSTDATVFRDYCTSLNNNYNSGPARSSSLSGYSEPLPRRMSFNMNDDNLSSEDNGITVKGSRTNQNFSYGYIGELEEQKHVIIFRLKGTDSKSRPIKKPILVRSRTTCETCGKRNESSNKFCSGCGTSLI